MNMLFLWQWCCISKTEAIEVVDNIIHDVMGLYATGIGRGVFFGRYHYATEAINNGLN